MRLSSWPVHMNHKYIHTMVALMISNTSEMKRRMVVKMCTRIYSGSIMGDLVPRCCIAVVIVHSSVRHGQRCVSMLMSIAHSLSGPFCAAVRHKSKQCPEYGKQPLTASAVIRSQRHGTHQPNRCPLSMPSDSSFHSRPVFYISFCSIRIYSEYACIQRETHRLSAYLNCK